jgi:hypothetical protein
MFEGNVVVYPIDCLQIFMHNQLTPVFNIFLVKDDLFCYYNVHPIVIVCS